MKGIQQKYFAVRIGQSELEPLTRATHEILVNGEIIKAIPATAIMRGRTLFVRNTKPSNDFIVTIGYQDWISKTDLVLLGVRFRELKNQK